MLVKELWDMLSAPVGVLSSTVDGIIIGDGNDEIIGIATTFICSYEIIEQAIKLGINVIISHESIYYNHHDQYEQYGSNKVIEQKLELLRKHSIHVIRFHDYAHRYIPDIITEGFNEAMGWTFYQDNHQAELLQLPPQSIQEIVGQLKERLAIEQLQLVGDKQQICKKVLLCLGFRGNSANCMNAFEQQEVDLVIAGEGFEWEMPEYIRDANRQGKKIAMIIVGHQKSEESGMKLLATRLQQQLSRVPITYIEGQTTIQYI